MVAALIHTINEEFGLFTFATMSTYFSIAGEQGIELGCMGPQPNQLLGNVAAIGEQGCLLSQALRVDAGAV